MAQYETTGGDLIITIPDCDCGSTGGCEKCQPRILHKSPRISYTPIIPSPYEQYIFERKAEIDNHLEWGIKYLWGGKWQ